MIRKISALWSLMFLAAGSAAAATGAPPVSLTAGPGVAIYTAGFQTQISAAVTSVTHTESAFTVAASEGGSVLLLNNASGSAATLPAVSVAGFGIHFGADFQNISVVAAVVASTSLIDGASSLAIQPGQDCSIWSDGTTYHSACYSPLAANNTILANTSGATAYTKPTTNTNITALLGTNPLLYSTSTPANGLCPQYTGTSGATTPGACGNVSISVGNGLIASPSPITSTGTITPYKTVNAQVGTTYTILNTDREKVITFNNASAISVTVPQANTIDAGWSAILINEGTGNVTLNPNTSTIDGTTSAILTSGQGLILISDSTNFESLRGSLTASGAYLPLSGGTLTGQVVLPAGTLASPPLGFNSTSTGFIPVSGGLGIDIAGSYGGLFTSGKGLLMGTQTVKTVDAAVTTPVNEFQSNSSGANGNVIYDLSYRATSAAPAGWGCGKSNSSTIGTASVVGSSDSLCQYAAEGSDGTNFIYSSSIEMSVGGTVSTGVVPGTIKEYVASATGVKTLVATTDAKQHRGRYGAKPAISSGTSGTVDAYATDSSGTITEGSSATGATLTFASPYTTYDHCTVTSEAGLQFSFTVSLQAITITNIGALSSTNLDYRCDGN